MSNRRRPAENINLIYGIFLAMRHEISGLENIEMSYGGESLTFYLGRGGKRTDLLSRKAFEEMDDEQIVDIITKEIKQLL